MAFGFQAGDHLDKKRELKQGKECSCSLTHQTHSTEENRRTEETKTQKHHKRHTALKSAGKGKRADMRAHKIFHIFPVIHI